jgi:hypothetical protein
MSLELNPSPIELAAQIIAVTTDDNGTLANRMSNVFSWMLALNDAEQTQCAKDLVEAARASFATGQVHLAIAELASWHETAINVAAGFGQEPVEYLETHEPVGRP